MDERLSESGLLWFYCVSSGRIATVVPLSPITRDSGVELVFVRGERQIVYMLCPLGT